MSQYSYVMNLHFKWSVYGRTTFVLLAVVLDCYLDVQKKNGLKRVKTFGNDFEKKNIGFTKH